MTSHEFARMLLTLPDLPIVKKEWDEGGEEYITELDTAYETTEELPVDRGDGIKRIGPNVPVIVAC